MKPGDDVLALPSGMTSKIAGIDLIDREISGLSGNIGDGPPRGPRRHPSGEYCRPAYLPKPGQDVNAMIC